MAATPHVVVVGSGVAGLSAAVTAAEELGSTGSVVLVERCQEQEAGGLTRWTSAYLRLEDVYETADSFVEDVVGFSGGRTRRAYVEALQAAVPDTMEWIQGHGARFKKLPTYFVNSTRPRLQPVGGGEALRRHLLAAAERLGVDIRYETTAVDLVRDDAGAVAGLAVERDGQRFVVDATAVVIASGGFEGNPGDLAAALGPEADRLVAVAPGAHANRGEGIAMALRAGAARSGEWDNFHAEPVDPRSNDPGALVMVFPYGILVNAAGRRFVDEGAGTVDEAYEQTVRAIWREGNGTAYFVTDRQLTDISD
ncbi:MAG: FAD-binding protein [Streptosporangiales bacterium]|nr:FAD-binding protein [Streptosporangiales bacterium]